MVYLFCNRSYGAPFVQAAVDYSRRTGTAITAVHSAKAARAVEWGPMGAIRAIATRLRGSRAEAMPGLASMDVTDVNHPSFFELVGPKDIGVIAGFDQIFSQRAIDRFESFVNVHPSLLPFYRGPEPAYWCIAYGETTTGFTIHTVTTRIDEGDIHYQGAVPIELFDDAPSLARKIAVAAVPAFNAWLAHVVEGAPFPKQTVDAAALYKNRVNYRSFRDLRAARASRTTEA